MLQSAPSKSFSWGADKANKSCRVCLHGSQGYMHPCQPPRDLLNHLSRCRNPTTSQLICHRFDTSVSFITICLYKTALSLPFLNPPAVNQAFTETPPPRQRLDVSRAAHSTPCAFKIRHYWNSSLLHRSYPEQRIRLNINCSEFSYPSLTPNPFLSCICQPWTCNTCGGPGPHWAPTALSIFPSTSSALFYLEPDRCSTNTLASSVSSVFSLPFGILGLSPDCKHYGPASRLSWSPQSACPARKTYSTTSLPT